MYHTHEPPFTPKGGRLASETIIIGHLEHRCSDMSIAYDRAHVAHGFHSSFDR
jgi:hypothetical protein